MPNPSNVEVLDNHCFMFHEYTQRISSSDFERYYFPGGFTVGTGIQSGSSENVVRHLMQNSLAFKQLVFELSRFLGCPSEFSQVLHERNKRAETNYREYVRQLFESEGIKTLLVDNGSKSLEDVEKFANSNPARTEKIFRLEPMIKILLDELEKSEIRSFQNFLERYDGYVENAVKKRKCLAFKSVIAYRVGLEIQAADESGAKSDFEKVVEGSAAKSWYGPIVKRMRDYLFLRALEQSIELGAVMQVHTGLGDTDIISDKCNPAFMLNVLKDSRYKAAKLVLIHGGFPYTLEAGWLANSLPNVYLEISSPVPTYFAPGISVERYKSILQWVPIPKVIYGSDASEFPETHWLMARMAKRAFSQALVELGSDGLLSQQEHATYMNMVFSGNAKQLYRLD